MPTGIRTLLLGLLGALAIAGTARAQAPVPLGGADPFALLAGTAVNNVGPTVVTGDLGVSPGATITGFPPGTLNGTFHAGDSTAAQAQADLTSAYNNAAGQTPTATIPAQLGGTTLPPGVYASAGGGFDVTGTLTLDGQGDGDAIFVFKATTLTAAAGSAVELIESAQACNVFWQVGGSATLGSSSVFRGNVLALTSITAPAGVVVDGRLLARNDAVALDTAMIDAAECDEVRPRVRISRVPRGCTAANFKARVRVTDTLGVTTDAFLDGRRIKRSTKRNFTVLIRARRLSSGRHTIRVVARDDAGNERTKKTVFERCARGISFTG